MCEKQNEAMEKIVAVIGSAVDQKKAELVEFFRLAEEYAGSEVYDRTMKSIKSFMQVTHEAKDAYAFLVSQLSLIGFASVMEALGREFIDT